MSNSRMAWLRQEMSLKISRGKNIFGLTVFRYLEDKAELEIRLEECSQSMLKMQDENRDLKSKVM